MLEGSKIQKYRISKLLSNSDYICHDENLCSYLLVEDKVEVKNKDLSFLNNGNTIRNIDKVYIEQVSYHLYPLPKGIEWIGNLNLRKFKSETFCLGILHNFLQKVIFPLLQKNQDQAIWPFIHLNNIWLQENSLYLISHPRNSKIFSYEIVKQLQTTFSQIFSSDSHNFLSSLMKKMREQKISVFDIFELIINKKVKKRKVQRFKTLSESSINANHHRKFSLEVSNKKEMNNRTLMNFPIFIHKKSDLKLFQLKTLKKVNNYSVKRKNASVEIKRQRTYSFSKNQTRRPSIKVKTQNSDDKMRERILKRFCDSVQVKNHQNLQSKEKSFRKKFNSKTESISKQIRLVQTQRKNIFVPFDKEDQKDQFTLKVSEFEEIDKNQKYKKNSQEKRKEEENEKEKVKKRLKIERKVNQNLSLFEKKQQGKIKCEEIDNQIIKKVQNQLEPIKTREIKSNAQKFEKLIIPNLNLKKQNIKKIRKERVVIQKEEKKTNIIENDEIQEIKLGIHQTEQKQKQEKQEIVQKKQPVKEKNIMKEKQKQTVSYIVNEYLMLINKIGQGVAKASPISKKLDKVPWFNGAYFLYKRFLYERKKAQKWLQSSEPLLCRKFRSIGKKSWQKWLITKQRQEMLQKIQIDNEKIVKSIIKMNNKLMKKNSLQGNLLIYASLDQFSKQQSKIIVSQVVKEFDKLDELQMLSDKQIFDHICSFINSLFLIAELEGKIKSDKPLSSLTSLQRTKEQLEEMVDEIYNIYSAQNL